MTGKGNAYENPLRDKSHGRIWRVVSRVADAYKPIELGKADPDELIEALSNDNLFWRLTAQRLLVERGNTDVLSDLYKLVNNQRVNEFGDNYAAIHALWTIDGLGAVGNEDEAKNVVTKALSHPSAGVRKAAIQVLSNSGLSEEIVTKNDLLHDSDPNTRLAAVVSLADLPPSESLGAALYNISLEESVKTDEWLSKAIYAVAHQHKHGFLQAFMSANPGYAGPKPDTDIKPYSLDFDDTGWVGFNVPKNIDDKLDGYFWFRKSNRPAKECFREGGHLIAGTDQRFRRYLCEWCEGGKYRQKSC